MNHFIKQSPITGLAGLGGGASGLGVAGGVASPIFAGGDRGIIAGGRNGGGTSGATDIIDYFNLTSTGDGADFGDLTQRRESNAGNITNGSRCCFGPGYSYSDSATYDIIDYVTSSSLSNATDFGDTTMVQDQATGCADANIGRGFIGPSYQDMDQLEYITIASTGNAADFGTLGVTAHASAATSDGVHGWWHGGRGSGGWSNARNNIQYLVTATLGNATDWGDLTFSGSTYSCTCSIDAARIVQMAGAAQSDYRDEIEYYTTASAGNASDFGDLNHGRSGQATTGNGTRAISGGGYNPSGTTLTREVDYITIASTGNASDFGDLRVENRAWCIPNSGAAS